MTYSKLGDTSQVKRPAKVVKINQITKLNYIFMEKFILKKAKLQNSQAWTTTITWYSLGGPTQIVTEQRYKRLKKNNCTRVENYTHEEFDKAYKEFHEKLAKWI